MLGAATSRPDAERWLIWGDGACGFSLIEFDSFVGMRVVSYLPMAHIAERAVSHYQSMMLGYSVYCCPDPNQLTMYLKEVHPQLAFGVPRVWEKIRDPAGRAAAAQVRRFLILHKELDADDGELTRTNKVRRGFIAEKYQPLVDALYSDKASQFIEKALGQRTSEQRTAEFYQQVSQPQTHQLKGGAH